MRIGNLLWLLVVFFMVGCGSDQLLLETKNDKFDVKVIAKKTSLWLPEGYDIIAKIKEREVDEQQSLRFDNVDLAQDFLEKFKLWEWSEEDKLCFKSDNFGHEIPTARVEILNPEGLPLSLVSVESSVLQCIKIYPDSEIVVGFDIPVDMEHLNWIRILVSGPQIDSQISKSLMIRKTDLELPITAEVRPSGLFLVGDHAEYD